MITNFKKLTLGLSVAALGIGGVACAQTPATPQDGHKMERPRIDANGDGIVTRAESQAAATAMFARLDFNKDGKLDQADRELGRQQKRDKMFAKLDTNGDGSISKAEFAARKGPEGRGPRGGHGSHGRGHGPHGGMMAMARDADTNKDGAISQAEFMAAAMKRFDAEDTNRDGQVTKAEREAAHAAQKAKWQARKADKKADKTVAN